MLRHSPNTSCFILVSSLFIPILLFFATGCSWQIGQSVPRKTDPDPESITQQVLQDENTNGWDQNYHGVLLNWRRDNLSLVNCSGAICDQRGHSSRHDGANDLRDLENLYWYRQRHPGDTSFDGAIAQIVPTVKQEWGRSGLDKGWVYYIFLRLAAYSNEPAYWNTVAQNWAQQQYRTLDQQVGVHHGPVDSSAGGGSVHLQDAYRVDHELEVGAALVDAGTRYQHPEWISAGLNEVNVVTRQAFSTTYHLFSRIYVFSDPTYGTNKIYDYQAKVGEEGQEVDALVRSGVYSGTTSFLDLAAQMLDALQALPVYDATNGGFYASIMLGPFEGYPAGFVDQHEKETRQLHVLAAVHLANKARGNRWAALEADLLTVATTTNDLFLPAPVPGYTYHQLPDWSLYPCRPCTPQATENWNSAEADNIALEGLQTVLSA